MRGGRALCHSRTDRWSIMGNMPEIIRDSTGHNERLCWDDGKLPGRHNLMAVKKELLMSDWFLLQLWCLCLLFWSSVSDSRALPKTFRTVVSKTRSILCTICVNDIFMSLQRSQMAHCCTSISVKAKEDWVSGLSQCVLLSICNTPFMSHLVKASELRASYFTVWTCLCFLFSPEGKIFKV